MSRIPGFMTRREFLIGAGATAVTIGSCEVLKEKPRLDEAIRAFLSSNPSTSTSGWTTYEDSWFPVKVAIPPTWSAGGLAVAEGGLEGPSLGFAIRKEKGYTLYDILVSSDTHVPDGWDNEKDNANYINNLKIFDDIDPKDVKQTKVRFLGDQVDMLSWTTGTGVALDLIRQVHDITTIKNGRRYQILIKGGQDFVISSMPEFRGIVDSYQITAKP